MIRPGTWTRSLAALSAAVLVGGVSCSLLFARPGKVVTLQGQTFEGDVTEKPDTGEVIIVRPNGERITLNARNIQKPIRYDPNAPAGTPAPGGAPAAAPAGSVQDQFQKRMAALRPQDVQGRIQLARWAFERNELDLAKQAVTEATQIDPRNQEARDLRVTIEAQQKLPNRQPAGGQGQPQGQGPGGNRPATPGNTGAGGQGQPQGQPEGQGQGQGQAAAGEMPPPLNPDQVNIIRQAEWSRNDRNVRVRLQNDVKRRFLQKSRDVRPADFNNLNAVEQGWQIVKNGTDDMANDVRLTNDPLPLQEYRTIVQRAILPTCAAAACHGGGGSGGRFQLYPRADHEAEAFANFLRLSTYSWSAGEGKQSRKHQMIDRDRPADSLLIQFALPQNLADTPHPDVQGFKPVFRTLKDPKYDQFLRWISNDLAPLQRDYGIDTGQGGPGDQDPGQSPVHNPNQPQQGQPQPGPGQGQPGRDEGGRGVPPRQPAPPPAQQRGA